MANNGIHTSGRVAFLEGRGELPMLEITTPWSSAELYLHGAHVTHFQRHGEPPLLFLSQCSRFEAGAPIRGGVPIIFPWFGKPADKPGQHGFARIREWELKELHSPANGSVSLRLTLPACPDSPECSACSADFLVAVSDTLTMELLVVNKSTGEFTFENCLHTYFAAGDIGAVSVIGLKGTEYLNQPTKFSRHTDMADVIVVTDEVDRAYLNTTATVEIHDASLRRKICVEKEGSRSTVVWNPWIAKAKTMPDFGDEEYKSMICVESGNVASNRLTLKPGECSRLKVILRSQPLT
jgi:glucose-6-phosphate 1-epimerase